MAMIDNRGTKPPKGLILYRGPSVLDGAPILVVVTGFARKSANPKTGRMLQTWIIRSDMTPGEATRSGADHGVCGSCSFRPSIGGGCYVSLYAPASVYRAYLRGNYRPASFPSDARWFAGRVLRLGAYGDPVAAPLACYRAAIEASSGHTGYTHGWRHCDPAWSRYLMASTEVESDATEARAAGWRTFRVLRSIETPLLAREIRCPASAEMNYRTTCQDCGLCDGRTPTDRRATIAIVAHGPKNLWRRQAKSIAISEARAFGRASLRVIQ